jgi:WhiB family redox-sensing transcriptional regulator
MRQAPGAAERPFTPIHIDSLHPHWQTDAKCLGVGNDYFFGIEEAPMPMNISQVRRASKLCETCPVFRDCITHALENKEEYGIWAGSTGKVRKNIRAMIARGEVTVPEVIEDYCNGKTEKYRPKPDSRRRQTSSGVRDASARYSSG